MRNFREFFQDTTVVWTKTFYSDVNKTTPVDPASVVFKLKKPSGASVTPTVANDAGTGNFSSSYVVDEYGTWEWRWVTSNPAVVDQGTITVIKRNVE